MPEFQTYTVTARVAATADTVAHASIFAAINDALNGLAPKEIMLERLQMVANNDRRPQLVLPAPVPRFFAGNVSIDDFGPFRAERISADYRWNGWACPAFTLDVVREMAQLTDKLNNKHPLPPLYSPITIGEDGTVTVWDPHNDPDKEFLDVYTPDKDGLYPIGSHSWCWSVDPEIWIADAVVMSKRYVTEEPCTKCARDPGRPHPCFQPKEHAQVDVDYWKHEGNPSATVRRGWLLDEIHWELGKLGVDFESNVEHVGGGNYILMVGEQKPEDERDGLTFGVQMLVGFAEHTRVHEGRPFGSMNHLRVDWDTPDQEDAYQPTAEDTAQTIAAKIVELMKEPKA